MGSKKSLIAGTVMLFSLIAGYFIVQGGEKSMIENVASLNEQNKRSERLPVFRTSPQTTNVASKYVESASNLNSDAASLNAMQFLMGSVFSAPGNIEMLGRINPDDPSHIKSLEKIILDKIDVASVHLRNVFNATVADSEIKTISDNSNSAKQAYLREIELLAISIEKANSEFQMSSLSMANDIQSLCEKNDARSSSPFFLLGQEYERTMLEAGNISAPSDWVEVHRKIMQYAKKTTLLFRSIVGCAEDQMKALVAIDNIMTLSQDTKELQALLNQKAKEIGYEQIF